jgi:hypothetical protein
MSKKFPEDFSLNSSYRMYHDAIGNYWFYHKDTFPCNEPLFYQSILEQAISEIDIWDPYINVNNNEFNLFSSINDNVTIKFLTSKKLNKPCNSNIHYDIEAKLKNSITHLSNVRFGIRIINESEPAINDNWLFHDRFLIIDKREVYLIGSSIGWHTLAIGATGIHRLREQETKEFIIAIFDKFWKYAASDPSNPRKGVEIPVHFI